MSTFLVTLTLIPIILATLFSSANSRGLAYPSSKNDSITSAKAVVSRTITVDRSGHGDFTTVQQAIDSVPINSNLWILIHIKAGIYNEKVTIPREKQSIVLQGDSSKTTIITYEDGGKTIDSTTFQMYASNFVARDITFKNTYNHALVVKPEHNENREVTWAPAALIMGDKASFRRCGFVSVQDTLSDLGGRHYYHSCYIEGATDFIWGNAQSFYENCVLNVTTTALSAGSSSYITAQGRDSANEGTGFVFHSSFVMGTGPAFLGRAYRNFSRVLYYNTHMDNIVTPLGWDAWFNVGHENLITYAEVGCSGPGADKSKRVNWEKQLSAEELENLSNVDRFINQDRWLQDQP